MTYSNTFNNISDIAPEALDVLTNSLTFSRTVSRKYNKAWERMGGKIGDTFNIRVPGYFNRVAGAGAVPGGYNDTAVPVVLSQYNSSVVFTSKEMTLNVDDMKRNVLNPLLEPIWEGIDTDGLALVNTGVYQWAGTPGTSITTLTPFLQAKATMEMQSSKPSGQDCNGALNPFMQATMLGNFPAYFNPQAELGKDIIKGELGTYAGIKYFTTANIPAHTTGSFASASPTVAASPAISNATGYTSIATASWGSNSAYVLKIGDSITISGVYAWNPANRSNSGILRQFTVVGGSAVGTQPVNDGSGNMTLLLNPPMVATGATQNVSALPTGTGNAIYVWGDASANKNATLSTAIVSPTSLAFYEDAFTLAIADLEDVNNQGGAESIRIRDPRTNLNLRLTKWYDGIADQGILRADVLYGWAAPRPGFAARVVE